MMAIIFSIENERCENQSMCLSYQIAFLLLFNFIVQSQVDNSKFKQKSYECLKLIIFTADIVPIKAVSKTKRIYLSEKIENVLFQRELFPLYFWECFSIILYFKIWFRWLSIVFYAYYEIRNTNIRDVCAKFKWSYFISHNNHFGDK